MDGMEVIIDDEPILEREDRPRSHTWPLPQPPAEVSLVEHDKVETIEETSEHNAEAESIESQRSEPSNTSSRKNSRKNAWGNLSYADLITQAIESSPDKRLTLSQIYDWMVKNIPYFKDKGDSTSSAGWKNSIRHNLSLHSRFMRIQNDQNGKSSYWVINPDAKPGKATRRRSGSVDGAPKSEKKRRSKKLQSCEDISNLSPASSLIFQRKNHSSESPKPTNATSPSSSTDSLSNVQELDDLGANFMFAGENFSRPRSTSNVSTQSSIGGRLTPIPGEEPEDEISSLASPYLSSIESGDHGRPRVSSAAEETANLVESMNLGRTSAGDTINLDESLKFDSRLTDMAHSNYNNENLTRVHSDSFSSVQSGDSGYESPAYFSSPVQGVPAVQPSRQTPYLMPGNIPVKPPPPYPSTSFTSTMRQTPQQMMARQGGMGNMTNGIALQKSINGPVGYYQQMSAQHCSSSQAFIGQPVSQPTQRLQHLPYNNNNSSAYTNTSTNSNYNVRTIGSGTARPNMLSYSDPYVQSGGMHGAIKDNRTLYSSMPKKAPMGHHQSGMPIGADGPVPSDLSHVELDSFHDPFQLACDLESILRNDMGETHMDIGFEQPMTTVNPYLSNAVSTVNNNYKLSMNGQSWVH